ncbi:hypothetical protein BU14_0567s0001 [Porphyra umbilicalis]|uniref:Uncharacterized protein n=1 Tax=Porphyra umbilicalis TaxID=2786 RepID=A0A1X6NRQ9_PORUM|nr:hypothetical protein BU14_0567s0001 [Porphyra umbilicalis]|eukprot:OSX71267.1 hypothetical protein BU14_0567s0001 [Porphyra umbilicalis]
MARGTGNGRWERSVSAAPGWAAVPRPTPLEPLLSRTTAASMGAPRPTAGTPSPPRRAARVTGRTQRRARGRSLPPSRHHRRIRPPRERRNARVVAPAQVICSRKDGGHVRARRPLHIHRPPAPHIRHPRARLPNVGPLVSTDEPRQAVVAKPPLRRAGAVKDARAAEGVGGHPAGGPVAACRVGP